MHASVLAENRHEAFKCAKDAQQVTALALYYFSRLKPLPYKYPFVDGLAKDLLAICGPVNHGNRPQRIEASDEDEKHGMATSRSSTTHIKSPKASPNPDTDLRSRKRSRNTELVREQGPKRVRGEADGDSSNESTELTVNQTPAGDKSSAKDANQNS